MLMLDLDHAHVIEEGEVVAAPIAAGEEGDPVPSVRVGLARGRDQGHQASPEVGQGHHKVNQGVDLPQETGSLMMINLRHGALLMIESKLFKCLTL